MKKQILLFLCIFVFAILLLPGMSNAAQVGKITLLEGRVDVLKKCKNMASPAKAGDPVDMGDIYRAKSDGKIEIAFINGNIIKIASNTRAEIKEAIFEGDKSSNVIKLFRGRVQAISGDDFNKNVSAFPEGNKFEVHTPNAVAGIVGSDMIVSFVRGVTKTILVAGKGYLFNPSDPLQIRINLEGGNKSSIPSPIGPPTPIPPPKLQPMEEKQPLIL